MKEKLKVVQKEIEAKKLELVKILERLEFTLTSAKSHLLSSSSINSTIPVTISPCMSSIITKVKTNATFKDQCSPAEDKIPQLDGHRDLDGSQH